ncbi:MAG: helix-turn-helix domain-containing protein [Myxococcota bacterium]
MTALLREHDGNVSHLAETLAVGRTTLYRWIKDTGVNLDASRNLDEDG